MVVFKRIPPLFIVKFTGSIIIGLLGMILLTWLANEFIEFEDVTTLLPSIAVFGTVMSLFLAFKTNEAYNRWWEARTLWGSMVNYSRSFARQVLNLLTLNTVETAKDQEELNAIQKDLIYRHLAFINALKLSLRDQGNWEELKPFLDEKERLKLVEHANIPTQLVQMQAQKLNHAFHDNSNDFRYMQIDSTLNEFFNIQGGCERINSTVFPRIYSFLTTQFTWLFAFSLIFSLYDDLNWQIMATRVVVAYVFLTLEKISRSLKDPFENGISDTPMTAICRTIEIDLREMLGEKDVPPPIKPIKGILY